MERIAVLASGGLDSAVLLAELARDAKVHPLYVESGLAWEALEKRALLSFLATLGHENIEPVSVVEMPLAGIYGNHWSTTGRDVPDYEAPDSAVYLPGRNVLLLGVAAVWSALHDVETVAIGSLDDNPFPDATPDFFQDYGRLLSGALARPLRVLAPFRQQHKWQLVQRAPDLPLHLTLTCMDPSTIGATVLHCGACNKCRERQEAFRRAGVKDRTAYAGLAS